MTDVMGYSILTANTKAGLESLVNSAINDGWQPHGSMSFAVTEEYSEYNQPMIMVAS